jgi:hypothetical protein
MKPTKGYWLDPVTSKNEATVRLGFELLGRTKRQMRSRKEVTRGCASCHRPLSLFAVYERSAFIPLERYAAIILEICGSCARESDGSSGANGFVARFTRVPELGRLLRTATRHLPASVYFCATPTLEPHTLVKFRAWKQGKLRPKLGGRQISIQAELTKRRCSYCGGPWRFVGSIAERWARPHVNFGGGFGYVFACGRECVAKAASFYWDR